MKVGDLVKMRGAPDICTVGIIIREPAPSANYIRCVKVLWPDGEQEVSEKWLKVLK